jgi:hypothetical protein
MCGFAWIGEWIAVEFGGDLTSVTCVATSEAISPPVKVRLPGTSDERELSST